MSALQNLGQWADIIGTALHFPEVHASERLAGGNTLNTLNYQYAHGNNPYAWTAPNFVPTYTNSPQGQQRNLSFVNKQGQPVTSQDMLKYGGVNNVPTSPPTSVPAPKRRDNRTGGSNGIPKRDYSKPSNWGFKKDGKWFQTPNDYYSWLNAQNNQPSQEQLQKQVDNAYAEAMGIYDQMKQNALGSEQSFYNQYTQPYEAQKPLLAEAKRRGLQNVNRAEDLTRRQEESALSAARRLYSELMQGTRQRYGGVNSTGRFANEFYGRELMRQKGNVMNTAGQNMQKLMDKKAEIEKGYQAQMQSLTQQQQAALLQAKDAFRQRIDAIDQARAGAAQNKAAMKLDALRNYRAQQQAIQNAFLQHKMQLDSMAQTANLNLRNALLSYQTQAGQAPDLRAIQSQFVAPILGGGNTAQTVDPTGYLSFLNKRNKYDQLTP